MEQFTKETYFTLTDRQFDSLVHTHLERTDFCSQTEYDWGEGQILQTETMKLSEAQRQVIAGFQAGYRGAPTYGTLFDWLCDQGHIPEGAYLIFVR